MVLCTNKHLCAHISGAYYHEIDISRAHVTIAVHAWRLSNPTAINRTADTLLDPERRQALENAIQEELDDARPGPGLQEARDRAYNDPHSAPATRCAKDSNLRKSTMAPKAIFSAMLNCVSAASWPKPFWPQVPLAGVLYSPGERDC